jgi:hypothetical protein
MQLISPFLPEQAKEFLRALHRYRHQVRVVRFLIAGNGQQRALRGEREPAIVHSNQVLNDSQRRITSQTCSNVQHFGENRRPRRALQKRLFGDFTFSLMKSTFEIRRSARTAPARRSPPQRKRATSPRWIRRPATSCRAHGIRTLARPADPFTIFFVGLLDSSTLRRFTASDAPPSALRPAIVLQVLHVLADLHTAFRALLL